MSLINDFKKAMRLLLSPKAEKWPSYMAIAAGEGMCLGLSFGVTADLLTKAFQNSLPAPVAAYMMGVSCLLAYCSHETKCMVAGRPFTS